MSVRGGHNAMVRRLLVDLTPLRINSTYRYLWAGGALTSMGSQLTAVAVGLQVYEISGSTLAVGFVGLAALVPLITLGLYGGSIVDAHDRRKVLVVTLLGLCGVAVALAVLAWTGRASTGLLYGLVALQSGFFAVHSPARSAVIPRLLSIRLLPAANALSTLSMGISAAVGPMLAGVLVDRAGYQWAYSAEAVLLLAALSLTLVLPPLVPEGEVRRAGLGSVAEGLRFLSKRPNLGMTFVVDMCAMVLALPRVLFPAIGVVAIGGGGTTVGVLVTGIAVGTFLGGLFSGRLGEVSRQGRATVVAVMVWGLSVAAFGVVVGLSPGPLADGSANWILWPATLCMVFAGAADTVSAVFRSTILQVETPDALRGRLQGMFTVVVSGGPHLGSLLLGAIAAATGEALAAVIGGLACALVVVLVSTLQKGYLAYESGGRVEATAPLT
ncbi:MAG TPA: MFS transporter [Acidimicrobiia bacterium]|nr:MFS transporter [Acidimicrobiia bacterium]